jgi:hypothetical protein
MVKRVVSSRDQLLVLAFPASEAGIFSFIGGSSSASNMMAKDHDEHFFR